MIIATRAWAAAFAGAAVAAGAAAPVAHGYCSSDTWMGRAVALLQPAAGHAASGAVQVAATCGGGTRARALLTGLPGGVAVRVVLARSGCAETGGAHPHDGRPVGGPVEGRPDGTARMEVHDALAPAELRRAASAALVAADGTRLACGALAADEAGAGDGRIATAGLLDGPRATLGHVALSRDGEARVGLVAVGLRPAARHAIALSSAACDEPAPAGPEVVLAESVTDPQGLLGVNIDTSPISVRALPDPRSLRIVPEDREALGVCAPMDSGAGPGA